MGEDGDGVKPAASGDADAALTDEDVEGVTGGLYNPVVDSTLGMDEV